MMKKNFFLVFLVLINFFLIGCGETPHFSDEEIREKNEENLTLRKENFQKIIQTFTLFSQKNLNLYFFSPEENSFAGKGLLNLTIGQQDDKKQVDFDFQMHYLDKAKNLPFDLQTKGNLINSGDQYWIKIDDFSVFMGTGNVNAEIFKVIGEEIQGKWIEIDDQGILQMWVYSGFDVSSIISQGKGLFSTAYYPLYTGDVEDSMSETFLTPQGEELQESIEKTIIPLLTFFDLHQETLTLKERENRGYEYRTPEKTMEVWQNLKLLGEDYGFSLTTSLSPKKIALQGKNFIEKVSLQSLEEEFDMSLEQKKGKNRILNFFKTLHGEKILKGSLGVNFKNDETIVFQGSLYDKAKELVNGLYFQLNFEGKFKGSSFTGKIQVPTSSVLLSTILQG